MTGVGLTGKTRPKGSGNFPVWEDIWGQGGHRTLNTIAERNLLSMTGTAFLKAGMTVYTRATQCIYGLNEDLATWDFLSSSPALNKQLLWYVDPSGSDANDGKTPATALLTPQELCTRLCPNGRQCNLSADVTVYINTLGTSTQSYPELNLNIGTAQPLSSGLAIYTFNVILGITSSAPMTITNHVQPSGSGAVRGQLTVSSGSFTNQERVRILTGSAAGAVAYSTGQNASAQNHYISVLSIPTIAGSLANGGHGTTLIPVPGDTCCVDTLRTTITRINVKCTTFARVFIADGKFTRVSIGGDSIGTTFAGIGGPVYISGSYMTSAGGRWENNCGGAFLMSCRTPSTGKTTLFGDGWCVIEHAIQGTLGLCGHALSYGLTIDGGRLIVAIGDDYNHPGTSPPSKWQLFTSFTNGATGGGIEFENGIGGLSYYNNAALVVCPGGVLECSDFNTFLWGGTAQFGVGLFMYHDAWALQGNMSPGVLSAIWKIPSLVNIVIANMEFAFSDEPIIVKNANSGLIAEGYNVANNYNETDAGFYKKLQNANIGNTNFFQIRKAGLYRVMGYVATTTADAAATGTPVLNVTYTDDSGVSQTKVVATGSPLTTLGGNGGQVIIEVQGPATLASWSITGVGSAGNAKYSVRMRVEKDCFGP